MSHDEVEGTKWYYLSEMWGGLGLFLIIVLLLIISFLNGQRKTDSQNERVRACGNASDVVACIKAVK